MFIAYTGFRNSGFIQFTVNGLTNGIATGSDTIPSLVTFNTPAVILSIIGLIITSVLLLKKVKGAYLIGIIATTLIGIPLGVTAAPDFSNYTILPSLEPTFLKLDFSGLFTAEAGVP